MPRFTDDVIFASNKTGLFRLLVLVNTPEDYEGAVEELHNAKDELSDELPLNEATYIITERQTNIVDSVGKAPKEDIFRVFFQDEFTSEILKGYPSQKGYDGHVLRRELKGKYALLRPDRFIFADCTGLEDLVEASKALNQMLRGGEVISPKL